MTFLSPLQGLLAAGLAGIILLVLYVLRLRRRPVRVSSIALWPQAVEGAQVNEPFQKLRPSWLLLLHALILALLAGAIARPLWAEADGPGKRVVLLMDASASMGGIDVADGPTRLQRAKKRALAMADELFRGAGRREVCVIGFAGDASIVTPFTTSRSAVAQGIESVAQTDQPGNLEAAVQLARSAAQDRSSEADEPASAVLLSDGSFAAIQSDRPLAAGMRVRFERIGPVQAEAVPDNFGLVGIAAKRDDRDPTTVRVFCDLLNTSANATPVALTLSVNGAVKQRRVVTVAGRTDQQPGRAGVTFELAGAGEGLLLVSTDRADALASDNQAGLMLPPVKRPAMVLVRPGGASRDEADPAAWLLEDVLTELAPGSLKVQSPEEFERGGGGKGADIVVFDRARPARLPECASIGFGRPVALAGLEAGEEAEPLAPGAPLFWVREHPLLRNTTLDSLVIGRAWKMRWVAGAKGVNATVSELISGPDGPLMMLVQSGSSRHVLASFELGQTNWPLQPSFAIFLADALEYLTLRADRALGRSFTTISPASVAVRGSAGRIGLRGPTSLDVDASGAVDGVLGLGVLPRAGVYLVEGDAAERAVVVNLVDATESSLANPRDVRIGAATMDTSRGGSPPVEVWPWLVACAAALLMAEWVVYGRGVRT
ncbi:MAG: VWA domain-containing protein [Planctomycetes bacterium]|nr:VWA domain-containing protein [Planctomycetota bacterium]